VKSLLHEDLLAEPVATPTESTADASADGTEQYTSQFSHESFDRSSTLLARLRFIGERTSANVGRCSGGEE
jgi:hypothetical protein